MWAAVTVWMFVTLIGAQNTDQYTEQNARAHSVLRELFLTLPGHEVGVRLDGNNILHSNFPSFQLFAVILVCSWLQAADKLYNPFQENKGFSVDLEQELDFSLWRSSKLLQHSHLASVRGKIDFLEL